MKLLSLLLLTVFLGKGCADQTQNDIGNATIEYTASTRGFYQKNTIHNQFLYVSNDRNAKQKPTESRISDANWKALIADFAAINLEKLPQYKAPTKKRFYDGAAIANIKITYKDKTYESVNFDDGTPPVEIEDLVNRIVSFSQKKE
jgi:hypothetical protein